MENLSRLVTTDDGSHTLVSEYFGQSYHSLHGALAESRRVYLELGFELVAEIRTEISVLEMGFGTGLNALLTWLEAERRGIPVYYTTLEAYPTSPEDVAALNYDEVLQTAHFHQLHEAAWGKEVRLSEFFTLRKEYTTLENFLTTPAGESGAGFSAEAFDLVYFDAFSPRTQPELWTAEVFTGLAKKMQPDGVLTTYSSRGSVRRALQAAGFRVEKHAGPLGKQEVVRAVLPPNGALL